MKHRNTVEFEIWGPKALFSDPITRVGGEKFSYQVPTYEAIKGILKNCYFKPTITWVIDEVRVMNPIKTRSIANRMPKYNNSSNDLSYFTYLDDCRYQVRAHFVWNENRPELEGDRNENKHHEIAKRSIRRGGRLPMFFGTSECECYIKPCVFGEGEGFYDNISEINFGIMYHGKTYPDEAFSEETKDNLHVRLANIVMKNGVIKYPAPEECIHRLIKPMKMKIFSKENNNITFVEEEAG